MAARDDIDAATIATPSGAHEAFAIPFLKRGKSVLCEKPMEMGVNNFHDSPALKERHQSLLNAVRRFHPAGVSTPQQWIGSDVNSSIRGV